MKTLVLLFAVLTGSCGGGLLPETAADGGQESEAELEWTADGVRDNDETDVDCGGSQAPSCAVGQVCEDNEDCASAFCGEDGRCAGPSYSDGVQNGDETDVDCGGTERAEHPCEDQARCLVDDDCSSNTCSADISRCVSAGCRDGVQNGTETDVDCGGGCEPCDATEGCLQNSDCISGLCDIDACTSPQYVWDVSEFSGDCSTT
ncbi:MAG: hypothetical protein AAFU77_18250, partial [Myxococcota bacterium]